MASEIGKAYVQIVPSARGISGKIQQELNGGNIGSEVGNLFGKGFGATVIKAIGAAGIGLAIRKTISDSVKQGAELEQSLGGVETLFKDSADKVKENAKKAYQTAGVDANSYMQTVTSYAASLLTSCAGDTNKAADIADMAMVDMSDNANKMGTSMEAIQNAYNGFAKQNYTMLDNLKLGYGGTKTEMERLLADAEKLTGKKYDISNLSDVYEAIHVIQGELGITGTTANEAATTVSGSFNMLKSSWTDLLGNLALGQDVGASLTNVITSAGTFMANLIPMVVNVITSIPTAIMEAIPSLLPALQDMGAQIISNIAGGTEMNIGEMLDKGIEVITGFTNSIFENLPQLITTAGTMISTLAGAIMTNLPTILEKGMLLIAKIAEGFIQNLPAIIAALLQMFNNIQMSIISHLPEMIEGGLKLIGKLAAGIIRAIPEVIRAMVQIHDSIKNSMKNVDWAELGKNIIRGIINGIKALASEVTGAIKDVVNQGLKAAKEALGIASPSKVFRDEVGKWIPAGVAVGIQANTQDVTGAIEDMKAQAINASQMQISTTYSEEAIREREERMDAIVGLLATYLPECATPTVIDGESMMETINTQLGLGVI
jgi:phage-related protein